MKRKIELKTLDEMKDFANKMVNCPYEVDLLSGRYVIDAKSMMGILSLDFNQPVYVEIHGERADEFYQSIASYLRDTE